MGFRGFLTTLAIGAGAMYLMDPERGETRRNELKDQFGRFSGEAEMIWHDGIADLQHRAEEFRSRTKNAAEEGVGQVTGAARQAAGNLQQAAQGVTATGEGMETRFGGVGQMAPGPRLLLIAGGGLLTLYGRTQRGIKGGAFTALGLNFLSQGLANKSLPEIVRKAQESPMFQGGSLERAGEKLREFTDFKSETGNMDSSMRDFEQRTSPEETLRGGRGQGGGSRRSRGGSGSGSEGGADMTSGGSKSRPMSQYGEGEQVPSESGGPESGE